MNGKPSEIERMLQEEIREKKRTGNGIHSRTGTRGYVGTMRTAIDFLKGKEKRAYRGTGKVVRYNMYEQVMSMEAVNELPKEEQKNLLIEWRKRYKNKEIAEKMNTKEWKLYALYKELGVPVNPMVASRKPRRTKEDIKKAVDSIESEVEPLDEQPTIIENTQITEESLPVHQPAAQQLSTIGLNVQLEGMFEGREFSDKLTRLAVLLEVDSAKYDISLSIRERVE